METARVMQAIRGVPHKIYLKGVSRCRDSSGKVYVFTFIYLATAFARGPFINYFTVSFYIVAPHYWICILGRMRHTLASYNYLVGHFQAMQLLKLRLLRLKIYNIIVTVNLDHHAKT